MKKLIAIVFGVCLAVSSFGQGFVDARIEDRAGRNMSLDRATWVMPTITYEHHEVHSGSHYCISITDTDLDTAETNGIVLITTNSTKWVHMLFSADDTVAATLSIYEGIIQTNLGAAITPINSDRNSTNLSDTKLYQGSTTVITNFGTVVKRTLIGTNNPLNRQGGGTRGENEYILKQNTAYAILIEGNADNGRANVGLCWYEHTNKE